MFFIVYATILVTIYGSFSFFKFIGEIDHFTLDFPILDAGPSEKFLIVDHPK